MKELVFQRCPECGITKTSAEFNKGARPNGLGSYCKECCYIRHACRTYKISKAVYLEMVKRADGFCEMCGEVPTRLVVDHDHATGLVRGLICDRCNHFLGFIETKPKSIMQAQAYLASHAERTWESPKE